MANPNPNQDGIKETNFKNLSQEDRREIARKGAEATNKILKQRKTMKEMLDILLSKDIKTAGGENTNALEVMMTKLVQEAMNGSIKAITIIRDTIGEKPVEMIQFNPTQDDINNIQDLVDGK